MATVDDKPSTRLFPTCFLREKGDTWVPHWNKQQRLLPATGGDPSPASPVTIAGSLMPHCPLGSSAVVEYLVLHFKTPGSLYSSWLSGKKGGGWAQVTPKSQEMGKSSF